VQGFFLEVVLVGFIIIMVVDNIIIVVLVGVENVGLLNENNNLQYK